jgi:hypothetical protein
VGVEGAGVEGEGVGKSGIEPGSDISIGESDAIVDCSFASSSRREARALVQLESEQKR